MVEIESFVTSIKNAFLLSWMSGRLLSLRGGAKWKMEGSLGKRKEGPNGFGKREEKIRSESPATSFPLASEEGVSKDILFFVILKLNRPLSQPPSQTGARKGLVEGRKEERWSPPQTLRYLFL